MEDTVLKLAGSVVVILALILLIVLLITFIALLWITVKNQSTGIGFVRFDNNRVRERFVPYERGPRVFVADPLYED